LIGIVK